MTPRNTTHGASASARRTPAPKVVRSAPTPRTATLRGAAHSGSASGAGARLTASSSRGRSPSPSARPKPTPARPTPARPKADPRVAWRWWLLPLVVLAVAAIFVATYYPVARVQYRETREKVRLAAELKGIEARNGRLQASVDRLKTPEGVEDYARSQLGLVKAGEHVVVIVDGSHPASSTPATEPLTPPGLDSEEAVVPPVGPWTRFLDSIFGVQ